MFWRLIAFFLENKANEISPKRNISVADLRQLAEELGNCKLVSSGRTLEEELGQSSTLANSDETKSWLPVITKWTEAIKSKVRKQFTLF